VNEILSNITMQIATRSQSHCIYWHYRTARC